MFLGSRIRQRKRDMEVARIVADEEGYREGITADDVMSRIRWIEVVKVWHATIARLRAAGWSSVRIGMAMGLDHSTVLKATKKTKGKAA
jgi:chromosomal replication initiation ATPase DnaA